MKKLESIEKFNSLQIDLSSVIGGENNKPERTPGGKDMRIEGRNVTSCFDCKQTDGSIWHCFDSSTVEQCQCGSKEAVNGIMQSGSFSSPLNLL